MSSHQIQFLTGTAPVLLSPRTHSKIIAAAAAALAAALLGSTVPAAAYPIYWPNQSYEQYDDYYAPPPVAPRKRAKPSYPKMADAPKDLVKPKGPLVIAISIGSQRLKIYDSNGLFAETPVSTGMRGHSTPMGVFSIIQKSKWHRSNLYSDAPMPYMQRITWSGVALHAGVLPGYPASHGCIRMPMSFATKLWSWGKLGARVIIAPDEMTPEDISHRLLATRIPAVAASVAADKLVDVAAGKADKVAASEAPAAQSPEPAPMELRLAPKHDDKRDDQTAQSETTERVRLADAGGAAAIAVTAETKPETKPEATPAQPAATSDTPAPSAAKDAPAAAEAGKDQGRPTDAAKEVVKETVKDAAKDGAKDSAKDAPKAETQVAAAPKRTGHVAIFISRKEGRLYVRQNFEPLFDVPVTIAQSDRPLGTHVFTARADGTEAGSFRWSVVSPPDLSRTSLAKKSDILAEEPGSRRRRPAPVEEAVLPPSPTAAEALDRLTIPDDVMTQIASLLAPGASIIVSDRGLGSETGRGTDFIVPLR